MAVDGEDNIFMADQIKHRIQKFTAQGKLLKQVFIKSDKGDLYPTGVACNASNGRVYVVNSSRIQILNSDLSYRRAFGNEGRGEGQFDDPRHIACNSTGNIYMANKSNRIQVFTAEGKFLMTFGRCGEGPGELNGPRGVAVDNRDRVYVSEYGNNCISVFTREGQFTMAFGSEM